MTLTRRIKITMVAAGAAGAAAFAAGGMAFAGDDAPRTELRIVEHGDPAGAVPAGYAASPGGGAGGAAEDCPDKGGTSPAADPR
ncbi:hypothetical protein [Actinomadura sp. WMMB 499]|uniref:hypothetical protein n=1 Tax=Actinomadura sp. WMMB 499 TaxID=1219491 RepID=UPI001244CC9F|nr:hypothetical protein [Actinomadura sp. WMMB 499]QFG20856.1 hypothetical protein F7P10_06565 [Actinomadura sp. WMMB 499]